MNFITNILLDFVISLFSGWFSKFAAGRISQMATLGELKDSSGTENSLEIDGLARFAVDEHNKKENALLEFTRVVKAQEQVVAGTLHHLTIEVVDAGKNKLYEAKIWVKPWMNFKELQEFKRACDVPAFTTSDLGVKRGWNNAPPEIQDAANLAVKEIQGRSNCLGTYEHLEVVRVKAKVIGDMQKFDVHVLLKLNMGRKVEKYNVEVHKNNQGTYRLNHVAII